MSGKDNHIDTEFFECQCCSDEHTLKFYLSDYQYDEKNRYIELYTSVFLNEYKGIFRRFWIAIKYIFGYKCKYGHWDCFIMKPEDTDKFINIDKKL